MSFDGDISGIQADGRPISWGLQVVGPFKRFANRIVTETISTVKLADSYLRSKPSLSSQDLKTIASYLEKLHEHRSNVEALPMLLNEKLLPLESEKIQGVEGARTELEQFLMEIEPERLVKNVSYVIELFETEYNSISNTPFSEVAYTPVYKDSGEGENETDGGESSGEVPPNEKLKPSSQFQSEDSDPLETLQQEVVQIEAEIAKEAYELAEMKKAYAARKYAEKVEQLRRRVGAAKEERERLDRELHEFRSESLMESPPKSELGKFAGDTKMELPPELDQFLTPSRPAHHSSEFISNFSNEYRTKINTAEKAEKESSRHPDVHLELLRLTQEVKKLKASASRTPAIPMLNLSDESSPDISSDEGTETLHNKSRCQSQKRPSEDSVSPATVGHSNHSNYRLPSRLDKVRQFLIKFDGSGSLESFRQLFTEYVIDNPNIRDNLKVVLLREYVTGKAAKCMPNLRDPLKIIHQTFYNLEENYGREESRSAIYQRFLQLPFNQYDTVEMVSDLISHRILIDQLKERKMNVDDESTIVSFLRKLPPYISNEIIDNAPLNLEELSMKKVFKLTAKYIKTVKNYESITGDASGILNSVKREYYVTQQRPEAYSEDEEEQSEPQGGSGYGHTH